MAEQNMNAKIAQLLALRQLINNDPRLAEMNRGASIVPPAPPDRAALSEAAAVGDPFGILELKRMFGYDLSPMQRINEAHGLANNEAYRGWK
jgi:hypothetical protein